MGKLIRAVLMGQDDGNIIPLPDHRAKDLQVEDEYAFDLSARL